MMQGDPQEMIVCCICILPILKNIKRDIPYVTHTWYADDARALGEFAIIGNYFDFLSRQGMGHGYRPKPFKIAVIVHQNNLEAGKGFGERHRFKVCTGGRYLDGYIRDNKSNSDWLRTYAGMEEEHWKNQKNRREMSPGELRCIGMRDTIRVNISTTRHLGHNGVRFQEWRR